MSVQPDVGKHADRRVRAAETRLGAHGLHLGIGDVPGSTIKQVADRLLRWRDRVKAYADQVL